VQTPGQEHSEDHPGPKGKPVRVLVVDDSALIRRLLTDLLKSEPGIEVVGTARDGREAVLEATRLRPDVITLDVEMPEVSGLDALPLLLALGGIEVVMVSALTQEGADVTLQALELGAFDCMGKPEKNQLAELRAGRDLLVSKVVSAAQSSRRTVAGRRSAKPRAPATAKQSIAPVKPPRKTATGSTIPATSPPASLTAADSLCVVIGISTGGPQALSQVFPRLHSPLPPIVVVQHMPAQFTGVFAARLDRYSSLTVKHAEEGDILIPDRVLIAPGGIQLVLKGTPPHARVTLSDDPPVSGHRPSVDVLFRSAAKVYGRLAVGLLMTGMGRDGVDGCKAILAAGGLTLGQDEDSSVVYGMNKAAYLEGAIRAQFALDDVPDIIQNIVAFRASFEEHSAADRGHGESPHSEDKRG
jgi:two-component system, chemotaxis family, protein-glutamate methylesterase/glutaminase